MKTYSIEDGKIFKVFIERMVPMRLPWIPYGGRGLFEDIARTLPVKWRRIVGIILLSGGIILSIIGWVMMTQRTMGSGPEELIWVILLGLGVISMVTSIHFFRKFEHRGWLEDALFYWSFWSDSLEFLDDDDDRQHQIDCSSCNQKLNIPFSYSGNISCPACGINMELEEGIIQAEGNPSD